MAEAQFNSRQMNLVRWAVYGLVALVVVLPYLIPSPPMKFEAGTPVKDVFKQIDALKPGSHVLMAFDFDASAKAELEPMCKAMLKQCFKKGLIPVVMTMWPQGLDLDKAICEKASQESQKELNKQIENGKQWVFLGYRPGDVMLIMAMGENFKTAFDKDNYGQPTQGMEALSGVSSLKNMDMVVDFAAGSSVNAWIAYGSDKFGFPLAAGTTAVSAPNLYPFYQSRQIVGFLGGLRGAADYESLVLMPGNATRGMLAQSAVHVLIVVLIIGANVGFIAKRFSRGRKE